MIVQRHNRPERFIEVALILICFCAVVPGVAAVDVATGSFQVASVGETVSIPIILDSASGGISGYRITVSLSDQSIATITTVTFPDWAALKSSSALPSGKVILQGVDLSQQVPMGGTGVLLATLTVKGTATGSTGIVITPDPSMGVQNRNGDLYAVTTSMGTLTVGTPSPGIVPPLVPTPGVSTPIPTMEVPTTVPTAEVPTPGVPTPGVPATGEPTPVPTEFVLTPIPTGASPTPIPPSDGSSSVPIDSPVYPVTPIATSVPGVVSPESPSEITPTVIAPGVQPTFSVGKRYAIGNPGSFISTRFGSGGTPADTSGPRAVTSPQATLKPGSRAYGITPPAGRFIRWYPAARWKAGIK